MQERCTARELETSLADLLDLRILHGTNASSTNLDNSAGLNQLAANFSASNSVQNFDTVILAGNASFFARPEHEHHGIDLEDALTLFFLSTVKKDYVQNLFAEDRALAYDAATGRLGPSPALLEVCPLQRTTAGEGCLAHWHVRGRVLDVAHHSAFAVAGAQTTLANETEGDNAARDWLRARPWARHTEFDLDAITAHTRAVGAQFNVSGRATKAFVLASDMPVTDAGDEGEKQTFVQFYLRVLTARIDLRRNDRPPRRLHLTLPALEDAWAFQVNQAAHDGLASVFGHVLGLRMQEVEVPMAMVGNVSFALVLYLPWKSETAAVDAQKLARLLRDPRSGVRVRIGAGLRRTVGDLFPAALRNATAAVWAVDIREEDEQQNVEQRRRALLAEDTQSSDSAERRNVTSRTALTELRGVQNGDQLMTLLENTNVSTAALRRARVARMRAATPGLDACTMNETVLREAIRTDLRESFLAASRGTIGDIVVTSLVVLNRQEIVCDGNEATRRLLQAAGAAPLADVEIVLLPSAAVLENPTGQIFVEATPDLLRLGVKSFVPEPTQRSNSTLVFLGEGIAGDGTLFALPSPTTPPQTPAPAPSKVVPRDNGPEWALVGSTVLSCVAVAGTIFAQAVQQAGRRRGSRLF